jgi:hypothetical protein
MSASPQRPGSMVTVLDGLVQWKAGGGGSGIGQGSNHR